VRRNTYRFADTQLTPAQSKLSLSRIDQFARRRHHFTEFVRPCCNLFFAPRMYVFGQALRSININGAWLSYIARASFEARRTWLEEPGFEIRMESEGLAITATRGERIATI